MYTFGCQDTTTVIMDYLTRKEMRPWLCINKDFNMNYDVKDNNNIKFKINNNNIKNNNLFNFMNIFKNVNLFYYLINNYISIILTLI